MSPQDYEYLLVAVRVPRTQSDRSFLISKEWVDTANQFTGSKHGVIFESAKRITNQIRLVAQAGCCIASRCAAVSSSRCPLTAPPSCRLIAQASCCFTSHCAAVSSSCRAALSSSHCATFLLSHCTILLLLFYGTTFLRKGWRKICCRCRISRNGTTRTGALSPQQNSRRPQRWRSLSPAAPDIECCCRGGPRHHVTVAFAIALDAVALPPTLLPLPSLLPPPPMPVLSPATLAHPCRHHHHHNPLRCHRRRSPATIVFVSIALAAVAIASLSPATLITIVVANAIARFIPLALFITHHPYPHRHCLDALTLFDTWSHR